MNTKLKHIRSGKVGHFHYSPAVIAGNLCFCAGHLGIMDDGSLAGSLEEQTRQMLRNLARTLLPISQRKMWLKHLYVEFRGFSGS